MSLAGIRAYGGETDGDYQKRNLDEGSESGRGNRIGPAPFNAATAPIEKLIGIQIGAISFVDEAERLEAGYKPL